VNAGRSPTLLALALAVAVAVAVLAACGRATGDPRIAMVLVYEATHPTEIDGLWLDDSRKIGARASTLYLDALSPKQEAWSSAGPVPVPGRVVARWRYESIDPADEAAVHAAPGDRSRWRAAHAEAALRARIHPDSLRLLQREPDRHRLRLVLRFDRDRLDLSWQVRRWR
jgi:hypothetical protein